MSGWVSCAKPSRRNTDPGVSCTFRRIFFLNKTTQNTLVMLHRKFLRKKTLLSHVLSEFVIFLKLGLL